MNGADARSAGSVTRELGQREHEGKPVHALVAARVIGAGREELWDALTNAARIPKWFLPISGDLRAGGSYQLEGNAGGEIIACEAPGRFALTWRMHGDVSWVTVTLLELREGYTEVRLEHLAQFPADFWEEFGPGAVGIGWDMALFGLDEHFSPAPAVVPETAEAWITSEKGKDFTRRSSAAWCEASIALGTDAAAARAAADRVTAFYTGEDAT
ncbi:SRPBCC domain-containing protein [Candidatus Palauibacter sp.]|uniref:SRPBCC domain-containing protein n=1 Tax=Candidatus Palauibacter sp. TaxID=3101350 RepID=UPI003B527E08